MLCPPLPRQSHPDSQDAHLHLASPVVGEDCPQSLAFVLFYVHFSGRPSTNQHQQGLPGFLPPEKFGFTELLLPGRSCGPGSP